MFGGGGVEAGIWAAVRNGDVSKKRLRAVYQSNLHRVLAAATELIRETDFERYVLMGDHGEALGEYDQYHHGIEHPKVRVIPWATVTDVRDDAPVMWDYSPARPTEDATTVSRLEELGYLEE